MTCGPGEMTHRLLDPWVGWSVASVDGLSGLDGPGLELAPTGDDRIDPDAVSPLVPPPALARGCGPCDWYLVAESPAGSRLLRRTACAAWQPVWDIDSAPGGPPSVAVGTGPMAPIAVAASGHRVAVVDAARSMVEVWAREGEQLVASVRVDAPSAVALSPSGEIWVVEGGGTRLSVHDPGGAPRRTIEPGLGDPIDRLALGPCDLWLVTVGDDGRAELWRANHDGTDLRRSSLDELVAELSPRGPAATDASGFCLRDASDDPAGDTCFDWSGRPLEPGAIGSPTPPARTLRGQLLTVPIDSGIPRCVWHRVRIDAAVPVGTGISVSLASSEVADPPAQGQVSIDPGWEEFPVGTPHPADWQTVDHGGLDALVRQPPGRYLFVRVRLQGDGFATPTVRRLHLDLPRTTGLDSLPAVYRSDPAAAEFTERFLSLFDAELHDIDRLIERHPSLLDPDGVPSEVLPWLAELVGLSFAPEWDDETRRRLVGLAPELYRTRGTAAGLRAAIRAVFGVDVAIEELGPARPWGTVAGSPTDGGRLAARLGQVRLFGRSSGRLRLGTSALGRTPIKSFGNPDDDPVAEGANRIRVSVPTPGGGPDRRPGRERLRQQVREVVDALTPAHVLADVRFGGDGLFVGVTAAVGVDTAFGPVPAPVLGTNTRLGRRAVLWPSRRGAAPGLPLDGSAAVDASTYLE